MAKKSNELKERISVINKLGDEFRLLDQVEDVEKLSTGNPELDEALGGGLPKGRLVEILGPEASGKSYIALMACAAANRRGEMVCYIDAEHAMDPNWARKNGADPQLFVMTQPTVSAEDTLDLSIKVIDSKEFSIVVIDSTAALIPKEELEGDICDNTIALLARVMSKGVKKVVAAAARTGTLVIFINQLREKPNIGGPPGADTETSPGGRALKFYSSQRIRARGRIPKRDECPEFYENGRLIGHKLVCKVIKNKVAVPNKECTINLMYEKKRLTVEIIDEAVRRGVIEQSPHNGKKLTYRTEKRTLQTKSDWEDVIVWLRETELLIPLFIDMGHEDLDKFIESGDLTEQDVENYLSKQNDGSAVSGSQSAG